MGGLFIVASLISVGIEIQKSERAAMDERLLGRVDSVITMREGLNADPLELNHPN